MSEELKSTLKYLKNKNNTRRIKAITITEAQKVVEEIERLNNIIKDINKIFKDDDLGHIEKLHEIHKLVGSDKE